MVATYDSPYTDEFIGRGQECGTVHGCDGPPNFRRPRSKALAQRIGRMDERIEGRPLGPPVEDEIGPIAIDGRHPPDVMITLPVIEIGALGATSHGSGLLSPQTSGRRVCRQ